MLYLQGFTLRVQARHGQYGIINSFVMQYQGQPYRTESEASRYDERLVGLQDGTDAWYVSAVHNYCGVVKKNIIVD